MYSRLSALCLHQNFLHLVEVLRFADSVLSPHRVPLFDRVHLALVGLGLRRSCVNRVRSCDVWVCCRRRRGCGEGWRRTRLHSASFFRRRNLWRSGTRRFRGSLCFRRTLWLRRKDRLFDFRRLVDFRPPRGGEHDTAQVTPRRVGVVELCMMQRLCRERPRAPQKTVVRGGDAVSRCEDDLKVPLFLQFDEREEHVLLDLLHAGEFPNQVELFVVVKVFFNGPP